MSWRPWLLLGLLLCCLAVGSGPLPPSRAQEKKEAKSQPPWELAKEKLEAAQRATQLLAREYQDGKVTLEQFERWSRRWMDAQRDVSSKKADQLAAYEGHLDRMKQLEKAARDRAGSARGLQSEAAMAEYFRIEAQAMFQRARSQLK